MSLIFLTYPTAKGTQRVDVLRQSPPPLRQPKAGSPATGPASILTSCSLHSSPGTPCQGSLLGIFSWIQKCFVIILDQTGLARLARDTRPVLTKVLGINKKFENWSIYHISRSRYIYKITRTYYVNTFSAFHIEQSKTICSSFQSVELISSTNTSMIANLDAKNAHLKKVSTSL